MFYNNDSERPVIYDHKSRLGDEPVDVFQPEGLDYPILERMNNALVWPEGPKGRIDLQDTYEVSSVPEDPGTPLESVNLLKEKGTIPN